MLKKDCLILLKEIEEIREKAEKDYIHYPTDYTIRLIQAVNAEKAHYKDRLEWVQEIRKIED